MTPVELLLFGVLCYVLGFVSELWSSPGSWTTACSRSTDVGDERGPSDDYSWARQVAALLLIGVIVVIVVLDVVADDYEVNPPVLVPRC